MKKLISIAVAVTMMVLSGGLSGCSSGGASGGVKWEKRLETQQMYFSAPNYNWPAASESEVDKVLDAIVDAGLDGPSIEFVGMTVADEYNGAQPKEPIDVVYRRNIKKWGVWEDGIRKRGLIAHIAFLNTNSKQHNKLSDSEWSRIANEFIDAHGARNKIVLPASETDPRTRASIRAVLHNTFLSRMPSHQVLRYGSGSPKEYHSQRGTDIPKGDKNTYVVSDSGPAIGYLYGGDWRSGGTPNLANIATYTRTIGEKGCSGAIYSFGRKFDFKGCKECGKAWGKR